MGNNHLRRVLIEAAWHYRRRPCLSNRQRALRTELDPCVLEIAWKAQLRLNRRYARLNAKTKPPGKVVTALARELVGFICHQRSPRVPVPSGSSVPVSSWLFTTVRERPVANARQGLRQPATQS
jgi:hypothetical protein